MNPQPITAAVQAELRKHVWDTRPPPDLEVLRDADATLVPKPFPVGKLAQAEGQTGTKTDTSGASEIHHAQSAQEKCGEKVEKEFCFV